VAPEHLQTLPRSYYSKSANVACTAKVPGPVQGGGLLGVGPRCCLISLSSTCMWVSPLKLACDALSHCHVWHARRLSVDSRHLDTYPHRFCPRWALTTCCSSHSARSAPSAPGFYLPARGDCLPRRARCAQWHARAAPVQAEFVSGRHAGAGVVAHTWMESNLLLISLLMPFYSAGYSAQPPQLGGMVFQRNGQPVIPSCARSVVRLLTHLNLSCNQHRRGVAAMPALVRFQAAHARPQTNRLCPSMAPEVGALSLHARSARS
jgi:hypothetical protein